MIHCITLKRDHPKFKKFNKRHIAFLCRKAGLRIGGIHPTFCNPNSWSIAGSINKRELSLDCPALCKHKIEKIISALKSYFGDDIGIYFYPPICFCEKTKPSIS
jgi:hypothetical protein